MDFLSLFVIAVGLAMDSVAVCISQSMCRKEFLLLRSLKIALVFGFFQGAMPFFGYLAGVGFSSWIERFDHWFAFVILGILGMKMLWEGWQDADGWKAEDLGECGCAEDVGDCGYAKDVGDCGYAEDVGDCGYAEDVGEFGQPEACECTCVDGQKETIDWKKVVALSFATSIDALVTGLIYVPYPKILLTALVTIAVVTMLLSFSGMYLGTVFGKRIRFDMNIAGGIILILIGSKILFEHTMI